MNLIQSVLSNLKSINEVEDFVNSLTFHELCHTLSLTIGYEIGDLQKCCCGFWNDEVGIYHDEKDWQEWREAGRVNEKNEVLWYWNENDVKELLIDALLYRLNPSIN